VTFLIALTMCLLFSLYLSGIFVSSGISNIKVQEDHKGKVMGIRELIESELVELRTRQTNKLVERTNELSEPNLTLGSGDPIPESAGLRLG